MKIFRKYLLNFVLILIVAICPIVMAGCFNGDTTRNDNYGKALEAAVNVIKEDSQSQAIEASQMLTLSLSYEEVEDQDFSNLYLIDYMKESGMSKDFDFPETAFKAIMMETSVAGIDYQIYGIHKYSIDENNVSAEMVFSYKYDGDDYGFEVSDYEKINVEYDFDTDTLISFDWITYMAEYNVVYHIVYENETLKYLVEDSSAEYVAFLSQVATDAEQLFNTEELTSKVYDFKSAYRNVYYEYNGYYPDQQ